MTELLDFLNARLDERAAKARAATHGGEGQWTQVDPDRHPGEVQDEIREIVIYDEGSPSEEQAAHIAENDPARVLREVEAKRRIIVFADRRPELGDGRYVGEGVIRLLAEVYDAHPDYREEWRP